jgi:hypothetical protein
MVTNKVIEELIGWAEAVKSCDLEKAGGQLQQFRHLGASLIASKEFQQGFEDKHGCRIEPRDLACFCQFLDEIAQIEAHQIKSYD